MIDNNLVLKHRPTGWLFLQHQKMSGIKVDPRHKIRNKAKAKFGYMFVRIIEEFDLTVAESMVLLSDMLNDWCYRFRKHEASRS